MRKLGEQWVEEIDGKKHMFKAVTPIINGHPDIKDLGILNEDGLFPCPFCGREPMHIEFINQWYGKFKERKGVTCKQCGIGMHFGYTTKQEAIDAWNRRV